MTSQSIALTNFTVGNVLLVAAAVAVVWGVLHYASRRFEAVAQARPRTRFPFRVVETALRIVLWFAVCVFAARLFAPTQTVVLVVAVAAAIAIGLGTRDLIKDFIGGMTILVDRPYEVGDRVEVGGTYGEIRRIGLRCTKIMTPDDRLVTVPNSKLLDGTAQNANAGAPECVVAADVFLPPDTDPDLALRVGRECLMTSPYLCLRRRTAVALADGFSQMPYLSLKLEGYVYDHRFEQQMKTDLVRRCKAEFRRLGVLHDSARSEQV
jgi:small-conductance mechanosensitive channel